MSLTILLFDVPPIGGPIGIFLSIGFLFICLAVAVIAFKMLKKSVKMALRMVIVAAILIIALVGSMFLFIFGGAIGYKPPARPTPAPTRSNR
jgi:ABC-type transport system involved in multi-copper enzyme maturation permease subunit